MKITPRLTARLARMRAMRTMAMFHHVVVDVAGSAATSKDGKCGVD